jgi:hypothetical protein
VRPLLVVEVDPVIDDALSSEAVSNVLQIYRFVFEGPPEPFDKPKAGEANILSR